MTRKDYVVIAAVLNDIRPRDKNYTADEMFSDLLMRMSNALYRDNNNFDYDRFKEACEC